MAEKNIYKIYLHIVIFSTLYKDNVKMKMWVKGENVLSSNINSLRVTSAPKTKSTFIILSSYHINNIRLVTNTLGNKTLLRTTVKPIISITQDLKKHNTPILTYTSINTLNVRTTTLMKTSSKHVILINPTNSIYSITPISEFSGNFSRNFTEETFGNLTVNCTHYNSSGVRNISLYNLTFASNCTEEKVEEELPWYEDPITFMIAAASVIFICLLVILKFVLSYCSKYSGEYYVPRWKLPRRKKGKEGWVLSQIDWIPTISDVEPPPAKK
ncbi:uncharacterized protein LOC130626115 [Hydractinia symbiolongicarpus]|uniref:uncharacterized protein LOC130626115 n=1 Tax=Hydractinia symbiolongicarpus TaxID=13093 RepID=UPI00254FB126|nr:uncharacterized protein LOC130626115 [Hydractinia symbiolongicarpus]